MRVSADEVLRVGQWLLRARNVRAGNEDDPARAVLWLSARVDGVLAALEKELSTGPLAPGRDPMPVPRVETCLPRHLRADAGGASALVMGPVFLDWLAAAPDSAVVEITGLASPLWLLPHLAARISPESVFIQAWAREADSPAMTLGRQPGRSLELRLYQPRGTLWGLPVRLRMASEAAAVPGDDQEVERLDVQECQAVAETALDRGLLVDPQLWRRLQDVTAAAMVPESAASRARGAGGGDDNA